jgi:hypothetical protein
MSLAPRSYKSEILSASSQEQTQSLFGLLTADFLQDHKNTARPALKRIVRDNPFPCSPRAALARDSALVEPEECAEG